MSCRALTLPKYLDTPGPLCPAVDERVDQHGEEQHDAEEREVPGAVPARVDHTLEGHADDARAERGTRDGPIPAGEQAPAHDRGDDVVELVADALFGHRRRCLGERDD